MKKISFIIPLYNCGQYIQRCIDSIYSLPILHSEMEILVIDDGSLDKGADIVRQLSLIKSEVRLIQQTNKGASTARNRGLEEAQGKWVWFVDADDRVIWEGTDNFALKSLLELEDIELVCFNYKKEFAEALIENADYSFQENIDGVSYLHRHQSLYLWNKIFRRSSIINNRFVDGTKNIEDMYFDMKAIVNMEHVLCIPVYGYIYNQLNFNSTSKSRSLSNLRKLSDDTQLIHSHVKQDIESMTGEKKDVFQFLLNLSSVGYIYSLVTLYPIEEIRRSLKDYQMRGLYPIKKTGIKKYDLFLLIANRTMGVMLCKFLFKVSSMSYKNPKMVISKICCNLKVLIHKQLQI